MVQFSLWVSKIFGVNVLQVFPVRGHSFSQCDRNFGLVKSYVKKEPTITTTKPYLEAMVHARKNPPFTVVFDKSLIKDWSAALEPMFLKNPTGRNNNFRIQSYVQIKYKANGALHPSCTYEPIYCPFNFLKTKTDVAVLRNIHLDAVKPPGIKGVKLTDVKSLFKFMDQDSIDWIEVLLKENAPQLLEDSTVEEISDEDVV